MNRDYVLGRNVAEQAKAKEGRGTVVVSFRIKAWEFDQLTDLAERNGRTISEVARRAFRFGISGHFIPFVRRDDTAGSPATWTY